MLNSKVYAKAICNAGCKKGLLVIISSPTAGGKTTVGKELVKRGNGKVVRSISATSRAPRKGEISGKDYFFVGSNFSKLIKQKYFLEWERVHDNYYGTPRKFVEAEVRKNKAIVMTIDVKGGLEVKKKFANSALIFLAPPSLAVLKKRLENRGTENAKQIAVRLKTAVKELRYIKKYDYLVINDRLPEAVKAIESIIAAERLRN